MTIDHLYNDWIELKAPILTKHVIKSYISAYDTHILPVFGGLDIENLNYISYQKFANSLLGSGYAPKTVKNILAVLSGIYTYAIKNDLYDGKNYPQMVDLPKYDNKFYISISPELQKKYLLAILNFDEPIYKDMFLMLLHGRRLGEVLNLKWEHVDLQSGMIYLPSNKNKSRKNLQFQISDKMVDILKEYQAIEIERQGIVFVTGYVFKNPKTGNKFSGLAKPWKRLLDRAGLDKFRLHSIRHLVGSYLVNQLGVRYEDVSVMLGHTNPQTAMRYLTYKPALAKSATESLLHDLRSPKEDAVAELNAIIDMGESIQKVLFSAKELAQVNHL